MRVCSRRPRGERYPKLVDGLAAVGFTNVHELHNQTDALRLVALVDRLYDAQVRIVSSGIPLDRVFATDMLAGRSRMICCATRSAS